MFRVTVEPAVLLYCVSQVVHHSLLQDFIFTKLCYEQYSQEVCVARWKEDTVTDVECVEYQAVNYVMWLSVITSILSVIMAQFFGVALDSEMSLVVALLYIVFILPDSQSTSQENAELPQEHSGTTLFTPVKSVLKNFTGSVSTVLRHRPAGKRTSILLLILADFFIAVVYSAEFDLLYMYMHNYLGFNLDQYSLYLVIKNLVNGISLLGVLPLLRLVFDSSDASLGILGGASRMVAFTMLALNSSHTLTYIVPFLDVFGQYLFVVLRSSLCGLVNKEEQGRVLTVLSSLAQMSMLVGSLLFDNVYPALVLLAHPGYTFLMAATSMATATTIFICIRCCRAKEGTSEETQPILR